MEKRNSGSRGAGETSSARSVSAEYERLPDPLRQSVRRYRRIFEDSQEGIAITTPAGEIIDVNPAGLDMLGYSEEEIDTLTLTDLYVDPEERRKGIEILKEEGAVRDYEVRLRRKDGEEIICQFSSTIRKGVGGEGKTIQTFFRDVTEQKRMQQVLRESERKYRRLFEESRDAVVLTTPEGAIVDANSAAEKLFGYSSDEFERLDASALYADPSERKRRILPALEEATSSRLLEAEMRHKEGHTFLASASVTVHRDEEGHPELIQALVRDITDWRRMQREVLQIQEEERRRFGQDLHDGVASQLTGISVMLGVLERGNELEEDVARRVNEIRELVDESCQDVRRLSRGLAPAGLSEAGLPSALERLAENVEGGRFEKDDDLPTLEDDAAAHLYWIAQEAVTNARKYAEADEIAIRLVHEERGPLMLEVDDDGEGFETEKVEDGLGLRTMQYRAELLGATLTIDSSPGMGTCVRCCLPVDRPEF